MRECRYSIMEKRREVMWEVKKRQRKGDLLKPEIYSCMGKSVNMKNGWVNP
jgi:hypothetical protein